MRTFVQMLRDDLRDAGAPHDDETVWKTLARLQILIFDFTNNGSATEELARDRAVHVLPPEDRAKAASLWSTLTDLALEVAANGGDRDRARLIADLQAKDFRLAEIVVSKEFGLRLPRRLGMRSPKSTTGWATQVWRGSKCTS
jgi:hypothetical protein